MSPATARAASPSSILIGAVPPIMVKTPANPGGLPIEVFDGLRKTLAENRAQFYLDFSSGPFYGFNRPGAKPIPGVIQNWWRQAMMGSAKAHYDGIKAFSETDFTEDLKIINVPTLVMHGDDDQIVPIAEFRAAVREASEEWHAQGLREVPARHVHHARRCGESRPCSPSSPDSARTAHRRPSKGSPPSLRRWIADPVKEITMIARFLCAALLAALSLSIASAQDVSDAGRG